MAVLKQVICCLIIVFVMKEENVKAIDLPFDDEVLRYLDWNTYIQLCGGSLSDLLHSVCNGNYNEDNSTPPGYIAKRMREGPATQCCFKSCQLREMKAYCVDQSITGEFLPLYKKKTTTEDPTTSSTTTEDPTTMTTTTTTRKSRPKPRFYPKPKHFFNFFN